MVDLFTHDQGLKAIEVRLHLLPDAETHSYVIGADEPHAPSNGTMTPRRLYRDVCSTVGILLVGGGANETSRTF